MHVLKKQNIKCIVYGTGDVAREFCKNNTSFDIMGCLDGFKVSGNFEQFEVLSWDDITEGIADAIVIAVGKKNLYSIFKKIQYRCNYYGLDIYDIYGNNLNEIYHDMYIGKDDIEYYGKSYEDLLNEIDQAECISFDLFDTLIMRKTLYREDIFYLTDIEIRKKGIVITDFVKKRITAELEGKGSGFDEIYRRIQEECGLTDKQTVFIQEMEYRIEIENIACRERIVEALEYAIKKGKRVNIITDMYYSERQLRTLTAKAGIRGFESIYISSDNKETKNKGVFELYREKVKGEVYLHIGDSINTDAKEAERAGIKLFYIKSGIELLKMSSIRGCMRYEPEIGCRMYLGLLVSELFNNPFCLAGTSGMVREESFARLIKGFLSPIAISYAQYIRGCFDGKYAGILFVARDGWLFKKIFEDGGWKEIPTWYFMSSRKAAYSVLEASDENKEKLRSHLKRRGYSESDAMVDSLTPHDKSEYEENINAIKQYLNLIGVDCRKRYLLCDLASAGSTQYALNHDLFEGRLDGVYLYRERGEWEDSSENWSMISEGQWGLISFSNPLLEMIFTSFDASVDRYTDEGNPVFQKEKRTTEDLEHLSSIHEGIRDRCKDYIKMGNYKLSADFSILMIRLMYEAVMNARLDGRGEKFVLNDDLDDRNIFDR